jgi:hypothetical protein
MIDNYDKLDMKLSIGPLTRFEAAEVNKNDNNIFPSSYSNPNMTQNKITGADLCLTSAYWQYDNGAKLKGTTIVGLDGSSRCP